MDPNLEADSDEEEEEEEDEELSEGGEASPTKTYDLGDGSATVAPGVLASVWVMRGKRCTDTAEPALKMKPFKTRAASLRLKQQQVGEEFRAAKMAEFKDVVADANLDTGVLTPSGYRSLQARLEESGGLVALPKQGRPFDERVDRLWRQWHSAPCEERRSGRDRDYARDGADAGKRHGRGRGE
eukprot:Rhum_TRINITY_DN19595_c0_g1::Rhum_TRINITY_DN19595_c0_g1_i1::g.170277::m.170277